VPTLPIEPVLPSDYLLLRLAVVGDGRRTAKQLSGDLKARLPAPVTLAALEALQHEGLIATDDKVSLTDVGRSAVTQRYGALRQDRKYFENQLMPALCLGISPSDKAASRLSRPDTLRAVALTRLYRLPLDPRTVTAGEAFQALFKRGIAGLGPADPSKVLSQTGAKLPLDVADASKLRATLERLALALGQHGGEAAGVPGDETSGRATTGGPPVGSATSGDTESITGSAGAGDTELAAFADRVRDITRTAHAGRFAHKTPIAHVYDVYGGLHADAGSLDAFKQRLLAAATAGHLALLPLDDPTAMDEHHRHRCEIVTPTERLHFVQREDG
jgi:hypothetical protein